MSEAANPESGLPTLPALESVSSAARPAPKVDSEDANAGGPSGQADVPGFPNAPKRSLIALYPNLYTWFILFSALDIMLTHQILYGFAAFGGREVNTIADWVISRFGLWGAIVLKCISVIVVIGIVELMGRREPRAGRRLMTAIMILSILPPAWALLQLLWFAHHYEPPPPALQDPGFIDHFHHGG